MDKLNGAQQLRALALDAASRVIAENLGKFINLGTIPENKQYTEMATVHLAKGFEKYIRDGVL